MCAWSLLSVQMMVVVREVGAIARPYIDPSRGITISGNKLPSAKLVRIPGRTSEKPRDSRTFKGTPSRDAVGSLM